MTICCDAASHASYYTEHDHACANRTNVPGVYMTREGQPLARGHLIEGWAAGTTGDDSPWLCVHGSAYHNDLVFVSVEAAEVRAGWLRDRTHELTRDSIVVRKVSRKSHGGVTLTNAAFRIIDER